MKEKTIVWIEDDTHIIKPVVRPLEKEGYQIVELTSATEALSQKELLADADLILLDMILPQGGGGKHGGSHYLGLDILRFLKDSGIQTPVIVLTVVTDEDVRSRIREYGVAAVLRKPVLPSKLKQQVDEILAAK